MRRNLLFNRFAALLAGMTLLATLAGCGKGRHVDELPMDVSWAKINNYFDRGRYLDASEHLEVFLINYAGSVLADSAQYLLAESHFRMKEYIISASEFQKLVTQYPRSPLVEEGEYKLGMSYYQLSPKYQKDQEYTTQAIDALQAFIEDFPSSLLMPEVQANIEELREKLARKDFRNGRLYHKMAEFTAARIYYQSVLDNYYDTPFAEDAQLFKARSWADQKEWADAIAAYLAFLTRYPDSSHLSDARREMENSRIHYQKQLQAEAPRDESVIGEFNSGE